MCADKKEARQAPEITIILISVELLVQFSPSAIAIGLEDFAF